MYKICIPKWHDCYQTLLFELNLKNCNICVTFYKYFAKTKKNILHQKLLMLNAFCFSGLFCHLTWCEVNVCGNNGVCNLTSNGWNCDCLPGFTGAHCQQIITPCSPNPCEQNGVCTLRNDSYLCICAPDYEGNIIQLQFFF